MVHKWLMHICLGDAIMDVSPSITCRSTDQGKIALFQNLGINWPNEICLKSSVVLQEPYRTDSFPFISSIVSPRPSRHWITSYWEASLKGQRSARIRMRMAVRNFIQNSETNKWSRLGQLGVTAFREIFLIKEWNQVWTRTRLWSPCIIKITFALHCSLVNRRTIHMCGQLSITITKMSCLGGCRPVIHKVGSGTLILSSCFRKSPKLSASRVATISLVLDFEGHKPKRNDNSCGVIKQQQK